MRAVRARRMRRALVYPQIPPSPHTSVYSLLHLKLVAPLDVLEVAGPMSGETGVEELHRVIPPGRICTALEAVDV